jgi:hypothetical protein
MCSTVLGAQDPGPAAVKGGGIKSKAFSGGLGSPSSPAVGTTATAAETEAAAVQPVPTVAAVTADQLKLFLELLLLLWPCPKANIPIQTFAGHAAASAQKWLLLFAALLQQAPSAAKLQLLEQRGALLLQLLYQVMLDENLGKCWSPAATMDPRFYVSEHYPSKQAATSLQQSAAAAAMSHDQASSRGSVSSDDAGSSSLGSGKDTSSRSSDCPLKPKPVKPVYLVLTVLQSLLYETVPMAVVAESIAGQVGRMLSLPTHGNAGCLGP